MVYIRRAPKLKYAKSARWNTAFNDKLKTNNLLGTTLWILINSDNLYKKKPISLSKRGSVIWNNTSVSQKDKTFQNRKSEVSDILKLAREKVGGKTNRFGELQIYSLLHAQSSVDFENTRWKCATYGVKWEAERCLFRRNLQPLADEHARPSASTICTFERLPDPNVFYSFEANTSKFVLARQARKYNTMCK